MTQCDLTFATFAVALVALFVSCIIVNVNLGWNRFLYSLKSEAAMATVALATIAVTLLFNYGITESTEIVACGKPKPTVTLACR